MVEDALKITRTLHGLVLLSCIITIIIAVSYWPPEHAIERRDLLNELSGIGYYSFVMALIDKEISKTRSRWSTLSIENRYDHIPFLREAVLEEISSPRCITITTPKSVTPDNSTNENASNIVLATLFPISSANYVGIQTTIFWPGYADQDPIYGAPYSVRLQRSRFGTILNRCPTGIADMAKCRCHEALTEPYSTYKIVLTGFLKGEKVPYTIEGTFVASVSDFEVSESSFAHWIENDKVGGDSVSADVRSGELRFAARMSQAEREVSLAGLSGAAKEQVRELLSDELDVSVLGNRLSGTMVLFASPIAIIVLLYLFVAHVVHVGKLMATDKIRIKEFSWLPIIRPKSLVATVCLESSLFLGLILLPFFSLILLYDRFRSTLGGYEGAQLLGIIGSLAATLLLGIVAWSGVHRIRQRLPVIYSRRRKLT